MDAVAAPGLSSHSIGLDLSTGTILVDGRVASLFKRGDADAAATLVPGDVLFCGLARR